ncbi:3-methyl-2-oxobutanoate hydroxymethyltransferase [Nisaea acidiphila]|uniref:3-methyl-2-oxobutanoate hydroxymethyltransferase n=1 Tax=Nisaea acidiphila TaxID=1862145 RepID=A0A9J7AVK8_9PROT|nr:3-methyl-2-oxobutanoate hydroxymethyltransferase [Nisaea acidiphila]UUX51375.1 3-methyl-2-oxobutanoate hydroxymethyltransferase [Nisaea acidiphila]
MKYDFRGAEPNRRHIGPGDIRAATPDRPLVCLTAYTAPVAAYLDPVCDLLLVGDSLGMVIYGMDGTVGVTLDMMIAHGRAVTRRARHACVVVDLPAGSYEDGPGQALESARRVMAETGADAVKLEGGIAVEASIAALVGDGIPVLGHIGLLPQHAEEGFRIQGRGEDGARQVLEDGLAVERASAFAVVIEGTVEPVARRVTEALSIPTIGIGASAACSGQILVTDDLLGLYDGHLPKFAERYADLAGTIREAAQRWTDDVRSRAFPAERNTYAERPAGKV